MATFLCFLKIQLAKRIFAHMLVLSDYLRMVSTWESVENKSYETGYGIIYIIERSHILLSIIVDLLRIEPFIFNDAKNLHTSYNDGVLLLQQSDDYWRDLNWGSWGS